MVERKCCPSCGLELPANAGQSFCPACLLRQGMESEAMSLSHPGEPGVTAIWNEGVPHRSVLDVLGKAVGAVPSVLLRDTESKRHGPGSGPMSIPSSRQPTGSEGSLLQKEQLSETAEKSALATMKHDLLATDAHR